MPTTPAAPKIAIPSALLKMTPRNWINVLVIVAGSVLWYGASQLGWHPIASVDAAHTATAAAAFMAGALFPGSPIGRVLDYVASLFGGPPAPPPSLDDVTSARDQLVPPTRPPQRIPPSSRDGSVPGLMLDAICLLGALGALAYSILRMVAPALLVSLGLAGCGASAIHTHAIAAHSAFVVETSGGATILSTEHAALDACPHDDGDARTHCIDVVGGVARGAAAIHDTLAPAVLAYRAGALTACGVDPAAASPVIPDTCPPDSPDVVAMLDALAAPVVAALPSLTAAVRALSTLAGGH